MRKVYLSQATYPLCFDILYNSYFLSLFPFIPPPVLYLPLLPLPPSSYNLPTHITLLTQNNMNPPSS